MDLPAGLRILVVADERDAHEISDMLETPGVVVALGDGTDETLVLAEQMPFDTVVITASLEAGDGTALVGALRDVARATPFHIVLVGDAGGPIRSAADASDLMIDRFVGRPLNRNALRFAVLPREHARGRRLPSVPIASSAPIVSHDQPTPGGFVREPTLAARPPRVRARTVDLQADLPVQEEPRGFADVERESTIPSGVPVAVTAGDESYGERLRGKMAEMARRLFQDTSPAARRPNARVATDVDFAAVDDAMSVAVPSDFRFHGDPSDIYVPTPRAAPSAPPSAIGTQETGQISVGVSDAATLVARLWQRAFSGQLTLSSTGDVPRHHQLFFSGGRLVFAASTAPHCRLGPMLVREGKVTAEQLASAWEEAALAGRRHGEVLVERGFLKRRELLPAVRRQLEGIAFSAFGWTEGSYAISPDVESGERVLLTRHTLALMAEGIRRKWSPIMQARCLGDDDTQFELGDRQKLKELLAAADIPAVEQELLLSMQGRYRVGHFDPDGQRTPGVDMEELLPLVWFAICLGAAHVFRPALDEAVLVSETDLAVDRARIARHYQLISQGDYFSLLGLAPDATRFEVKRAYEAMRREYAADAFPSAIRNAMANELAAIARALDEAYGVLVDDALRQAYGARLSSP